MIIETPSVDLCINGHRFAKMEGHPKKYGIDVCTVCLSIGWEVFKDKIAESHKQLPAVFIEINKNGEFISAPIKNEGKLKLDERGKTYARFYAEPVINEPPYVAPQIVDYYLDKYINELGGEESSGWQDTALSDVYKKGFEDGAYAFKSKSCDAEKIKAIVSKIFIGRYSAETELVDVVNELVGYFNSTCVNPLSNSWVKVDEAFLKCPPVWFYGPLWVYFGTNDPEPAKYEWQQGHNPDRIVFDGGGSYCAIGSWVMPRIMPPRNSSTSKQEV